MATSPAMNESPEFFTRRRRARIALVFVVAVVLPIGASILYHFSPAEYTFLPCFFHLLTGLHCPGCGATRCVHALLHLDFPQAFAYNSLFVLALPLILYSLSATAYSTWTGQRVRILHPPRWAVPIVLVVVFGYWILRNLPWYPFNLLAPHQL